MAKSTAQRVREAEASHLARGEKNIRIWGPNSAEAINQVREDDDEPCMCDLCRNNKPITPHYRKQQEN